MTLQEGRRYDPLVMLKWISAAVDAALDEILPEGLAQSLLKPGDVPLLCVDDVPDLKKRGKVAPDLRFRQFSGSGLGFRGKFRAGITGSYLLPAVT